MDIRHYRGRSTQEIRTNKLCSEVYVIPVIEDISRRARHCAAGLGVVIVAWLGSRPAAVGSVYSNMALSVSRCGAVQVKRHQRGRHIRAGLAVRAVGL